MQTMYQRTREVNLGGRDGDKIVTTVTKKASDIIETVETFIIDSCVNPVIGLDTELTLDDETGKTKTAILSLCNGEECLLVQLLHLDDIPRSLVNFLRLPNFSFVGVGIKESVHKLEEDYGIGCRNVVELGPLAANVLNKPRLIGSGVDQLAVEFQLVCNERPMSCVFDDWGSAFPNKKQIKFATINACAYYKIGISCLSDD